MTDNSKRIKILETFENKINILEEMVKLEKNHLIDSKRYKELVNQYKEEYLKYKSVLSTLTETEKNDIMTVFNMTFDNINVNLHFSSFLETDFYTSGINRILLNINDGFSNLYKNDIFEALDNDPEIKGGLLCLNKNTNNALELMNLEFLTTLYNILGKKIETNYANDKFLKIKYNLILIFDSLEELVVNNNFASKITTDCLYTGYDGVVYNITRDMINVAIIKSLLYKKSSQDIEKDLLIIESLSSNVNSKDRCENLKKDLEKFEKKNNVLTEEQKQKLKTIVTK